MLKLAFPAAVAAGVLFVPAAANAAAVASASLDATSVSVTFSQPIQGTGPGLFATAAAALGPSGITSTDSNPSPTVATATATDGTMTASSFVTTGPGPILFDSDASGSVAGDLGGAIGEVTAAFDFSVITAGTIVEITMNLTRSFDLATDIAGDLASGATSLGLSILNSGDILLPTIAIADALCNPNAAFTVTGGNDFLSSCTTLVTFTFAPLAVGEYTLTFASSSGVDVVAQVAEIPVPGAFGLFALGVTGFGFARKLGKPAA